jgi:predicted dehydrogenase
MPLDDNATVFLKFSDGTKGEFECSWTTRPYEVLTQVYGEKGKLTTSIGSKHPVVLTLAKTGKGQDPNCTLKEEYPAVDSGGGWENAVHYFIDCVIKGKQPFISGEEGRETIRVILAAYESNRKGKGVKIANVK